MSLFKSSLVILISFAISSLAFAGFTDMECLNGSFSSKVVHKELFNLENSLELEKTNCLISLDHKKLKYLGTRWVVDVCRAPVHIKEGRGSVTVVKKTAECSMASKDDFCVMVAEMDRVIQDDGLIFAKGEKENLSSDHGRVHCSNLLLAAYLKRNIIFSRQKEYKDVLRAAKKVVTPAPIIPTTTSPQEAINKIKEVPPAEPEVDASGAEADF